MNSPKRLPCGLAAPAGCRRPKARRSSLRAGRLPASQMFKKMPPGHAPGTWRCARWSMNSRTLMSLLSRRKYLVWRCALVYREKFQVEVRALGWGGDTSQTLLLRKKKYVPWRCALVYEWLRCEPWRPWGWGETTRGPRRPARIHSLVMRRKYVLWRYALVCVSQ